MTLDEIRAYYGIYTSEHRPRAFQLGRFLIMFHWGEACWDTLTIKNECQTDWFRLGKIRNLDGLHAYQLVAWRLIATWSFIK